MSWLKFNVLVLLAYLAMNVLFALVYMQLGPDALAARPPHDASEKFLTCFFFSAQTLTTVGYGQVAPLSTLASSIAAFEALLGLLSFALATGLTYGRVSRPSARLLFSPSALVAPYGNGNSLQFRVANQRSNILMDLEATVLLMTVETVNGELKRKFFELPLERNKVNFIPLTWTVVHPIDSDSPLRNKTQQDLEDLQAELLILIRAFDDTFSQTVHTRHSYRHEELVWSAKFSPAFQIDEDGDLRLDLRKINDYSAISKEKQTVLG